MCVSGRKGGCFVAWVGIFVYVREREHVCATVVKKDINRSSIKRKRERKRIKKKKNM
jgi:hypothetical protein